MSFLDKFKGKGRDADRRDDDLASMFDEVVPVQPDDMVLAGAGAGAGGGGRALAVDLAAPTETPVQHAAPSNRHSLNRTFSPNISDNINFSIVQTPRSRLANSG